MRISTPSLTLAIAGCLILASCGGGAKESEQTTKVSGGRSAVFSTDALSIEGAKNTIIRKSSTLGLFVTEYLTNAPVESAVQGAIDAIAIQTVILDTQQNIKDPDFELLQAFEDALQVDVSDLLNRSENREQALDTYAEALTNVATHANDRYKELSLSLEELKDLVRSLGKEKNNADRDVKQALKNKEYEAASAAQKVLIEKDTAYAEADLKRRQVTDIVTTLDQLLSLYGQKILAIQENREILISGIKVVDVPGIDDLKIIERMKVKSSGTKKSTSFDNLFEGSGLR